MADNEPRASVPFNSSEAGFLIFGFVCVSAVFAIFVGFLQKPDTPSLIALPMLSILGIALLLICLAAISYVFVRVNLQDRAQALGLPPGSIQAVIALSLVVLFAILSILVFTSTGDPPPRMLKVKDEAERNTLVTQLGDKFLGWEARGDKAYVVFAQRTDVDAHSIDTRNDIGKQLIVLIGTLMTSAVSFYFGTRATVAGADLKKPDAPDPGADPAPTIGAVLPAEGIKQGEAGLVTINGTGLAGASAVTFTRNGTGLPVTDLTETDDGLTCTVTPPQDAASGTYDLAVTIPGKLAVTKAGALTVVAVDQPAVTPPPEPAGTRS